MLGRTWMFFRFVFSLNFRNPFYACWYLYHHWYFSIIHDHPIILALIRFLSIEQNISKSPRIHEFPTEKIQQFAAKVLKSLQHSEGLVRQSGWQEHLHHLDRTNTQFIGLSPLPVTVTIRIIPFLVGDPNKPSFVTVAGHGDNPNNSNELGLL